MGEREMRDFIFRRNFIDIIPKEGILWINLLMK
jgi:hypothetical protein